MGHIKGMGLDNNLEKKVFDNIILNTFWKCTTEYARVLSQKNLCDWYGVLMRNLSEKEQKKFGFEFIKKIAVSDFYQNEKDKKAIIRRIIKLGRFDFAHRCVLLLWLMTQK